MVLAAAGASAGLGGSLIADRNFALDKGTWLEVQLDHRGTLAVF
ncbi:MAG TPA: hypothetical protein VN810_00200 [Terriglobales bacterium]|nr:hypothetical protein [Terriglobales bacterium]